MPASKHRRNGRQRRRLNRKVVAGIVSSPAAQGLLHMAALIDERALQLYGHRELTDDEYGHAFAQIADELEAWNRTRLARPSA